MNRRGFAAGHFGVTVGTDMYFIKVAEITGKHIYFS
jgi:hypothetical protein